MTMMAYGSVKVNNLLNTVITKNPLIRYKILDECFCNPYKNYYFETLLEAVNNELYEITGDDKGIKNTSIA